MGAKESRGTKRIAVIATMAAVLLLVLSYYHPHTASVVEVPIRSIEIESTNKALEKLSERVNGLADGLAMLQQRVAPMPNEIGFLSKALESHQLNAKSLCNIKTDRAIFVFIA